MAQYAFRYGDGEVSIGIEGASSVTTLAGKDVPPIGDIPKALKKAVNEEAISSAPLRDVIRADDLVTIVVSDVTRLWMRQDLVTPPLVGLLHGEIGVPYENIAVLVATGTHRHGGEAELRRVVSDEVYDRVRVVNHDAFAKDLVCLGTTSRGNAVSVNPLVVGRKVITVGGTVHHLMAGYGGGRKSILPGVSAFDTITRNHLHSLDPHAPRSNPLIGMGKLDGNPLNEDMIEAAAMVGIAFSINVVANSHMQPALLFAGDWLRAWRKSCDAVQEIAGVPIREKADVVIADCGGYPKDINLYQGIKSLLNAGQAVKKGGAIVFIAECREGGGAPEFFDWNEPLRQGRLDEALREKFTIPGYIFYAGCEVVKNARVLMLTKLSAETLAPMGIEAFSDAAALCERLDCAGKSVYLMPFGGSIVPYVRRA